MLQAAIKTGKLSVSGWNFLFKKAYWLILLGTIFNLNSKSSLAQAEINNIAINQNTITQSLSVEGLSGGTVAALEITQTENTATGSCDGFTRRQPNHILKLESFFKFLRLEVESSADTTIMVQGPGGIWCNDDTHNTNPVIEGEWQSGLYKVWVGSYRASSTNNYRIKITGKK